MSYGRAQAPTIGLPPALQLQPPRHLHLENGLELVIAERNELPVVDVQLVVRAGAAADDAARAGRVHLMADVLDQGTHSRTATQIAEHAELLGATIHTHGSWDCCIASMHVLSQRLSPALELLADIVTSPAFPEHEVARKRDERLAEILHEAHEPRVVASEAFVHAVYGPDHPFGLPLAGTRATVEPLTASPLRDFYVSNFAPATAFVVVVGDVVMEQLVAELNRLFGGWGGRSIAHVAAAVPVWRRGREVHIVEVAGAPQSELRVGCTGPPRGTPDYFPLLLANTILGGAFTSRLNMKLREEKGYTYGAGSSFALRRDGGPFIASTAVATAATADAVSDMVNEIGRMSRELVSAAELERAKNYLVLGLPRMFETTSDIADHLSEVALHGLGDDYYELYAGRVRGVTAEEVRLAAERWLRAEDLSIVIAGDAAAIAADVAALDIGSVHVREQG